MAVNWNAYEAAKELYGNNVDNIQDIGSRFPLFSRAVMAINDENLLDILGAIPKVTARVVETGLKTLADGSEPGTEAEEEEKKPEKKAPAKKTAKKEEEPEEDEDDEEETDYESMTAKALYALCCKRGLSGKCKERNKAYLIKVLKDADGGATEESDDEDDWDEEEDTPKDPYKGKGAKELFQMCKDRGIKTKPKMKAAEYVKLLKKADEAEAEEEESEDDDDEWDI